MFNIPFDTKIGHFERVLLSQSLSLYWIAFFWTVFLPAKQLTSKVIFKTTNCVDGRENKSDLSSIYGYFKTNEISAYFMTKWHNIEHSTSNTITVNQINQVQVSSSLPCRHNGRPQSAAHISQPCSVLVCRSSCSCPSGSRTAWQGRSCRKPSGTCTLPQEWTGYP